MSKLKLVGVSIGNLEDMTIRSIKSIFSADIVFAEDTRSFSKLKGLLKLKFSEMLSKEVNFEKKSQVFSYRDQNHDKSSFQILNFLNQGKEVILVSDAGMPLISDPGYKLVSEIKLAGKEVEVVPGPSSLDSALVVSGLKTDKVCFLGFLPKNRSKAKKVLMENSSFSGSIWIFESPARVVDTLKLLLEINHNFLVSVSTELTKIYEKSYFGSLLDVLEQLEKIGELKGEWVLGFQVY